MRIAILAPPGLVDESTTTFAADLAGALGLLGHEADVVRVQGTRDKSRVADAVSADVHDLVHTHGSDAGALADQVFPELPRVATYRSVAELLEEGPPARRADTGRHALRQVVRSRGEAQALREAGYPLDDISIVPLAVDFVRFRPSDSGAHAGTLRILARSDVLSPRALSTLRDSIADEHTMTLQLITSERAIDHSGEAEVVDDAGFAQRLAATDVYVTYAGELEAERRTLEAMACGRPAIAMTGRDVSDAVADGLTGFHAPVDDGATLRGHLERLRDDPELRTSLGSAASERVRARHTWAAVGKIFSETYEHVLRLDEQHAGGQQAVDDADGGGEGVAGLVVNPSTAAS